MGGGVEGGSGEGGEAEGGSHLREHVESGLGCLRAACAQGLLTREAILQASAGCARAGLLVCGRCMLLLLHHTAVAALLTSTSTLVFVLPCRPCKTATQHRCRRQLLRSTAPGWDRR